MPMVDHIRIVKCIIFFVLSFEFVIIDRTPIDILIHQLIILEVVSDVLSRSWIELSVIEMIEYDTFVVGVVIFNMSKLELLHLLPRFAKKWADTQMLHIVVFFTSS